MFALHVKIYETGTPYPVVEHIFRGRTREEAAGYFDSHMEADDFLYDCVEKRRFKSIVCRSVFTWERE